MESPADKHHWGADAVHGRGGSDNSPFANHCDHRIYRIRRYEPMLAHDSM